jgi:hypothetical protein
MYGLPLPWHVPRPLGSIAERASSTHAQREKVRTVSQSRAPYQSVTPSNVPIHPSASSVVSGSPGCAPSAQDANLRRVYASILILNPRERLYST